MVLFFMLVSQNYDIMLTQQQRLEFCRKCTNRKFNPAQGLLCNLSGAKPDFAESCENYNNDIAVVDTSYAESESVITTEDARARVSEEQMAAFKEEQNLKLALGTGIIVCLVCALLWAIISVTIKYQIGYMAVGVGAAVGFTIRYFGKGVDQVFGIIGAVLAFLGCVLGNYFSILGLISDEYGVSVFDLFSQISAGGAFELMLETFSPMDLLFYGLAIAEGYKFSFRTFNLSQLTSNE